MTRGHGPKRPDAGFGLLMPLPPLSLLLMLLLLLSLLLMSLLLMSLLLMSLHHL